MRVVLSGGVYELAETLRIQSRMTLESAAGELAVLSGGSRLTLLWRPFRDGIWQAKVPAGTTTDQLFINGRKQVLARYPNFDPAARYLNGTTAAEIAERSMTLRIGAPE